MRVLEQSGTMGDIPKTARADHVVVDQSEVAAFLATPATHGSGILRAGPSVCGRYYRQPGADLPALIY